MLASFGAFIVLNTLSQILIKLISLIPGTAFFPNIHISSHDFIGMQSVIPLAIWNYIYWTSMCGLLRCN
ncbi:hypothetical protein DSOL_4556 [Desulfosporosinus metallidurans]|uniref:Uncharacterized protein n=1 Tax=Desulfosporosinus metallidurans TaxID=1888891 RepID=A0A1Q8QJF3_9FIRM|nr:hypothetical protein DSOL_4556 [Desulfosporosinus metallidurans]